MILQSLPLKDQKSKNPMNILIIHSSFQNEAFVRSEYAELMRMLENEFQAQFFILGDDENAVAQWKDSHVTPEFVMTATGGVENLFTHILPYLGSEVKLIADGRNNSLAAALEILSFLTSNFRRGKIIHGSNEEIVKGVKSEMKLLYGLRIGCFGHPSDWLIDSDVDIFTIEYKYGISVVDINLDRLVEEINAADEAEAFKVAESCTKKAKATVEPSNEDMLKAAKTYLAIKKICKEDRLDAMTIRCFDIVKACGTTSCLALALLNDEGIVAGCEGDMQTLITMILAQRLCGEKAFMANPSMLRDDRSLLAHCTLPLSMCDAVTLRSHFESSIGVAIQGDLPCTDYTLLKWGGYQLDRFFVAEAQALPIDYSEHFCRTQILLNANLKSYLLNKTIGNHQVIIRGRHAEEIREFMLKNGVEEIQV